MNVFENDEFFRDSDDSNLWYHFGGATKDLDFDWLEQRVEFLFLINFKAQTWFQKVFWALRGS